MLRASQSVWTKLSMVLLQDVVVAAARGMREWLSRSLALCRVIELLLCSKGPPSRKNYISMYQLNPQ